MDDLFITGKKILERLKQAGFEAYFVGGCVRDYKMGREINDVDITTDALPEEVESLFENTVDVGIEHGTVIVVLSGRPFEVTTFRVESEYTDHRRPDSVVFTKELAGDLERRDFTMNAMAMDSEFKLIDPYAGLEAIKNRLITTVGLPDERFDEDALRILRAVRFKAQLGFTIDHETVRAMERHAGHLRHVAVERSLVELKKTFSAGHMNGVKSLMVQTGIKKNLPFIKEVDDNTFMSTNTFSFITGMGLQIYLNESLMDYAPDLKLSNAEKNEVKEIVCVFRDLECDRQVKTISYNYNYDTLENVRKLVDTNRFSKKLEWDSVLRQALDMKPFLPIQHISDIDIDGRELMRHFGASGGRWIREVLTILEHEILFNLLPNEKTKILEWMDMHVEFKEGNIKLT